MIHFKREKFNREENVKVKGGRKISFKLHHHLFSHDISHLIWFEWSIYTQNNAKFINIEGKSVDYLFLTSNINFMKRSFQLFRVKRWFIYKFEADSRSLFTFAKKSFHYTVIVWLMDNWMCFLCKIHVIIKCCSPHKSFYGFFCCPEAFLHNFFLLIFNDYVERIFIN